MNSPPTTLPVVGGILQKINHAKNIFTRRHSDGDATFVRPRQQADPGSGARLSLIIPMTKRNDVQPLWTKFATGIDADNWGHSCMRIIWLIHGNSCLL